MADIKISQLSTLATADIASGDLGVAVDVSDTSMAATGTTKKFSLADLARLTVQNVWTAIQTFNNPVSVPQGIRSGTLTLEQDTAVALPVPNNHAVLLIFPFTGGASGYIGMVRVRAGSSPSIIEIFTGSNTATTTGVLTGTTGNTSRLTISTHTDGNCYVENRRPLTQTFDYVWL